MYVCMYKNYVQYMYSGLNIRAHISYDCLCRIDHIDETATDIRDKISQVYPHFFDGRAFLIQ